MNEIKAAEETRIAKANLKTCEECGFVWSQYFYHSQFGKLMKRVLCPECRLEEKR